MKEKFDDNRNKFIISFGVSILILFFNVQIKEFAFFDNIDIPKNIEIYIILFSNLYFFYEITVSFLLIEKKEKEFSNIYLANFIICFVFFIIIILKILFNFIDIGRTFNFLLFIIFSTILSLVLFNFYFLKKKYNIDFRVLKPNIKLDKEKIESEIKNIKQNTKNKNEEISKIKQFFHTIVINDKLELDSAKSKFIIIQFDQLLLFLNFIFFSILSYLLFKIIEIKYYHFLIFSAELVLIFSINYYILKRDNFFKKYEERLIYLNKLYVLEPILKQKAKNDSIKEMQKKNKDNITKNPISIYSELENQIVNSICTSNLKLVKEIFKKNANIEINSQRNNGWTYLHYSVAQGEFEISKYLLENGADPNIINHIGICPINYAVNYNNISLIKLLISYHSELNLIDSNGYTLIYRSIINNNLEIFKILHQNGAKINIKCNGISVLEYCKKNNRGKIVKYIKDVTKK